jgi:hypothetical protein
MRNRSRGRRPVTRPCPCDCGRTYDTWDLEEVDRWIADHPNPVWPGTDRPIYLDLSFAPIEGEA